MPREPTATAADRHATRFMLYWMRNPSLHPPQGGPGMVKEQPSEREGKGSMHFPSPTPRPLLASPHYTGSPAPFLTVLVKIWGLDMTWGESGGLTTGGSPAPTSNLQKHFADRSSESEDGGQCSGKPATPAWTREWADRCGNAWAWDQSTTHRWVVPWLRRGISQAFVGELNLHKSETAA